MKSLLNPTPCLECGRPMTVDGIGKLRCRWCLANRLEAGAKELEKTDVDLVYARRESESRILVLEAEGPWL